jgi:hypothetical protein
MKFWLEIHLTQREFSNDFVRGLSHVAIKTDDWSIRREVSQLLNDATMATEQDCLHRVFPAQKRLQRQAGSCIIKIHKAVVHQNRQRLMLFSVVSDESHTYRQVKLLARAGAQFAWFDRFTARVANVVTSVGIRGPVD